MKNPFEIRTEVMAMAKDFLDKQYEYSLQVATATDKAVAKTGIPTMMEKAGMPAMYTMEDLLKTAREMYNFIEKSGK